LRLGSVLLTVIVAMPMENSVEKRGWYPDPWGQARWRWWNGKAWTDTSNNAEPPNRRFRRVHSIVLACLVAGVLVVGFVAVKGPAGPPRDNAVVKANKSALRREASTIAAAKIGGLQGRATQFIEHCQYDSTARAGPEMTVRWDPPSGKAASALQVVESRLVELGYHEGKTTYDTSIGNVPNASTPTFAYSRRVGGATMRVRVWQYKPVAPGSIDRDYDWYVPNRVDLDLDIEPDGC